MKANESGWDFKIQISRRCTYDYADQICFGLLMIWKLCMHTSIALAGKRVSQSDQTSSKSVLDLAYTHQTTVMSTVA